MADKKLLVYIETAPVHVGVIANGLSHAAVPIIQAFYDLVDEVSIFQIGSWFSPSSYDPVLAPRSKSFSILWKIALRAAGKVPFISKFVHAQCMKAFAGRLKRSSAEQIFSFIGADYQTIFRTEALANMTGKTFSVYLVDDFVHPLRLRKMPEAEIAKIEEKVGAALRRATCVFTITDNLGRAVAESYGVRAITLPLSAKVAPRPSVPVKDQIFYLGSTNFLYADSLQALFRSVGRVRERTGRDLKVRLTVSLEDARSSLEDVPDFVVAAPIAGAELMAQEIAASLAAYIPYTFDVRHKAMVTTSFPSKSLEYFKYARSILVYGPDYSSAMQYFAENKLPVVCASENALDTALLEHLNARPDHSGAYTAVLEANHSEALVRGRVLGAMFGDAPAI
jgi:hypothetical protein